MKGPAPEMSEDQIRHMYELARKLKERKRVQRTPIKC